MSDDLDLLINSFEVLRTYSPEEEYQILIDTLQTTIYTKKEYIQDINRFKRYSYFINLELYLDLKNSIELFQSIEFTVNNANILHNISKNISNICMELKDSE